MPIDTTTAKERFLKRKDALEAHRGILSHPQFEDSIQVAMIALQEEVIRDKRIDTAAPNHFTMVGAMRFVQIFKNLSDQVDPPKQTPIPGLRHDA